ncbi:Abscisic acid receptor PYL8 [Glycine soja]|uniref:Abscisic acid receptor PYL8 n=1 Tax=Glycine soja TaxID=3848 RepID=A0A445L6H4_GLYSO|nr:Abscisic acid receptor PYL8 [Glycine soja]
MEYIGRHHRQEAAEDNQCGSSLVKHIRALLSLIAKWVGRGNLEIGSLREVGVKSSLPATTSTERLEILDDNHHKLSVKIIGSDHRLRVRNL